MTLSEAFEKITKEFPDKVCFQLKKEGSLDKYTYREVYDSSQKIASWLINQGVSKGDRVAIILENGPCWGIGYFGIIFAGATAVPLDIQSSFKETDYSLRESQCKVVFAQATISYLQELEKFDFLKKIVIVDEKRSGEKCLSFSEILFLSKKTTSPKNNPSDLASIIYTSGTTSTPKGVMLTHQNFYSNFLSLQKLNILQPSDNILSILPLHHSYPFMVTLLVPIFLGVPITYLEHLRVEEILKALKEEKITIMVVVPQILHLFYQRIRARLKDAPFYFRLFLNLIIEILGLIRYLLKVNLGKLFFAKLHSYLGRNLRFFVCGGAKLDKEVAEFFFKLGFKIIEGYGLTEASPVVSLNPLARPKIGSVGKVLSDIAIKILNPDEKGIGEISLKGPNIMKGYYLNPKETEATLKDGWLYTQDLGCLDEGGYLYIKDRVKEIIVLSSGKNISYEEVETHYLKSPFIKEVCVMSDEKNQVLVAVVVPNLEHFKKLGEANIYEVIKWRLEYLSQGLPSYKRVRDFVLTVCDLPRTRLGKIKRFKASEIYKENLKGRFAKEKIASEAELSAPAKEILVILKKFKDSKSISLDDHLEIDLGIDSLEKVEIVLALEKALRIKIDEESFAKVFTVRELINHIEAVILEQGQSLGKKESILWKDILDLAPKDSLRKKIDLKLKFKSRLATLAGGIFLDFLFRIFFKLKVYERGNLLKEKFILCPNHTSYLDGFVIFSALSLRLKYNLFFIGLNKYFDVPIIKGLIKYLRVIPVDTSRNLTEAMKAASLVLRNKKVLCIFPEGSRSVDGGIKEFKKGVGILAKELDVKIIPVYIEGAYRAWKPTVSLPRPKPVRVIFGKAKSFAELKEKGLSLKKEIDEYQAISLGIEEEVRQLALKLRP